MEITSPMLSQHSRCQALVKEEGCDKRGEPTLNLAILMEMKLERKPLGRNPLSDAPYQNPGMVLNNVFKAVRRGVATDYRLVLKRLRREVRRRLNILR